MPSMTSFYCMDILDGQVLAYHSGVFGCRDSGLENGKYIFVWLGWKIKILSCHNFRTFPINSILLCCIMGLVKNVKHYIRVFVFFFATYSLLVSVLVYSILRSLREMLC